MNTGLRLRQDLRQKLELQLTPRQILQNEILMLPLNALRETLQQEVEENVFLQAGTELRANAPVADLPGESAREAAQPRDESEELRKLAEAGAFHEYLKGNRGANGGVRREAGEERNLEGFISRPTSWRDDLVEQLRIAPFEDEALREAAIMLVGWLDQRGGVPEDLDSISAASDTPVELLEEALDALQREAPPGVGARNLQERLLLQLKALPARDSTAEAIIAQCYDDLLKGRFARIEKRLEITEDELLAALQTLKGLSIEAAELDDEQEPIAIEPDATIARDEEGKWVVSVYHGGLPPIRISKEVATLCSQASNLDAETRQYLQAKLSRARWMREAVERRHSTLRRIIEEIVRRQEDFFEKGHTALVPLRQEEVATAVELHPSRVSRAIQEKYVETSFGVFPLKFFFPRGVENADGDNVARDNVQSTLEAIIDEEDPLNPLSDDALVEALKDRRVDISRRTVCKYRDELGIPPASARKGVYHRLRAQRSTRRR